MADLHSYWQQITLTSGGNINLQSHSAARAFIERLVVEPSLETASARSLQRHLVATYNSPSPDQTLAELCLQNFITHALHQRCVTLANQFGRTQSHSQAINVQTPFTTIELFCCVFEAPFASGVDTDLDFYDPLIKKILTTFDPEKGGLTSWCTIRLQGSRAVKRFLREHGIVLETDWQLLCRIGVGKFQRLLTAADCTTLEIENNIQLLNTFHKVYKAQLDERRRTHPSRRPYPAPSEQQLIEMNLSLPLPRRAETHTLSNRLKQLAQYIRQDRCRGPSPPKSATTSSDRAIEQLLDEYCQPCLAQAVEQTIERRLVSLKQKRQGSTKAQQFLQALALFYCNSQPMKEIAASIGLRDQSSVSRLLKRDNLRADIRRQVLACLLQRVRDLAVKTQSTTNLQALDQQITNFLEPYIDGLIAADQREGYTSKHRQMTSAYANQLCRCATHRRNLS